MAGATLLINDGSTTFHLVTYLKNMGPLTIYTNSLAMIAELAVPPVLLSIFWAGNIRFF